MLFKLLFTERADFDLNKLEADKSLVKRLKAVKKALGYLEKNRKHPGLNTHEYDSLTKLYGSEAGVSKPKGGFADLEAANSFKFKIYEAYAENNTPAAYRIFWHYGPDKKKITIIAITPHP